MTFDIQWKSGFGYGDFATGLGYAHNAAIKFSTDVKITFHWDHDNDYIHDPNDPETIIERFWSVYNDIKQSDDVNVQIKTNSEIDYRFVNNLHDYLSLHGIWESYYPSNDKGYILIWTSRYNTYFPGYHKDPIYHEWDELVEYLELNGYQVIEITYRTPVQKVLDLIRNCHMGIGYDGMVHQLFKFHRKPCLIFCERSRLNNLLLPFAEQESNLKRFKSLSLEYYKAKSKERIRRVERIYHRWLSEKEDYTKNHMYNVKNYK